MHATGTPEPEVSAHSDPTVLEKAAPATTTVTQPDNDPLTESSDDSDAQAKTIDGGSTAWLVVLGAWCSSFCSYGWINSVGIFQEYYATGPLKDYSPSQIAWIPSLQIFFMSFLGPLMGVLFDRYGPRPLLLVGSFMHVFGLMMASISSEYYQFMLSQGACSAIGVAAVFIAAVSSIGGWFDKRRGLAFGTLATGSSLGGVVLPIMITKLIESVGYGWAMRTGAFLIGALLIVCIMTVKRRANISVHKRVEKSALGRPFRERVFLLLLAGLALVPFGLYTPITYLPTLAIRASMATSLAKNLVAIYNAGSLIGRLGSGILSDKYGRFNVFVISCYASGILLIAMWIPGTSDAATVAFAALFGVFSGAYIALVVALVAQISPIEEIGYRNGIASLVQAIGSLVTSPIAGAIIEKPNGVLGVKLYSGAFLLAGTTCILLARMVRTRWQIQMVM